jgi:glycosyltransferase involved in cell wall biosynthesis
LAHEPTARPGRVPGSITLVSFAFNEQDSLPAFLARAEALLHAIADDFEFLLVDDGSTDGTAPILEAFSATRPWVKVVRNPRNMGTAWSVKAVIPIATKQYFFWQTVDWSYDLTCLVEALPELARVDVLQGYRGPILSRGTWCQQRSDTAWKAFVSVVNYLLVRLLFGLPLRDYQNITVYPTRLLQGLHLESNSAFTSPEMLLKAWWKGATFLEVPVPFRPRRLGRGKGTRPRAIAAALRDILVWFWRWRVLGRRPDRGRGRVVAFRPLVCDGNRAP